MFKYVFVALAALLAVVSAQPGYVGAYNSPLAYSAGYRPAISYGSYGSVPVVASPYSAYSAYSAHAAPAYYGSEPYLRY